MTNEYEHSHQSFEEFYGWDPAKSFIKLPQELLESLYEILSADIDFEKFSLRIRELATRYRVRKRHPPASLTREERDKLSALGNSLEKSLKLYFALPKTAAETLDSNLNLLEVSEHVLNIDFRNANSRPALESHSFSERLETLKQIVRNAQDSKPVAKGRPSTNGALTELILELGAMFEMEAREDVGKLCYYDGSTGEYTGRFFFFVDMLLTESELSSPYSNVALGKTIQRAFSQENKS
ncbi:hypothetical protein [Thalassovita aquimarina]|uniref:Uncharacterized protein n=1 Tax=Thalassovita aquimarina TaxID=2785917 RepID=A0ABS5HNQ5_9RHOB|nr:hypothetical protein [Thalassovita aquimarina]MBR9650238.1 hypothetical protein [Thalassovita aquimarina]